MRIKTPSFGFGWRSILTSVLGVAVLMSGFFWLGYWTAELNIQVRGDTLFVAPSPRNLPRPLRDDPATKKTEKADPDREESSDHVRRWISL